MAGKTAIVIQETEEELVELLRQKKHPSLKEHLQVLYANTKLRDYRDRHTARKASV